MLIHYTPSSGHGQQQPQQPQRRNAWSNTLRDAAAARLPRMRNVHHKLCNAILIKMCASVCTHSHAEPNMRTCNFFSRCCCSSAFLHCLSGLYANNNKLSAHIHERQNVHLFINIICAARIWNEVSQPRSPYFSAHHLLCTFSAQDTHTNTNTHQADYTRVVYARMPTTTTQLQRLRAESAVYCTVFLYTRKRNVASGIRCSLDQQQRLNVHFSPQHTVIHIVRM